MKIKTTVKFIGEKIGRMQTKGRGELTSLKDLEVIK